jgi:23S rRNA (uracil1939-C5)-methyltransferase
LAAKRDFVREALRRLGGIEIPVPEPIARGGEFGDRNRVTFATGTREGRDVRGLRALEAPEAIVDVRVCMLAEAPVVETWTALRDAWTKEPGRAPGPGTRITVRASASGDVDVMTRGETSIPARDAAHLVDTVPGLTGWHHAPVSGDPECVAGAGRLVDRWQGRDFELPAGVFLQVNREVSSAMDEWIDERAGPLEGRRVLDLYAGVGARAIRWSEGGANVVSCEVSPSASAACRTAAGSTGRLEVVTDRVESQVESLMPADLVVVNPPRAGLSRTVADRLAVASAEELVYVSCDPATLARDLKRLGKGWSIREVQPFDAFPQTSHVETIVWMCRTRGSGVAEHE